MKGSDDLMAQLRAGRNKRAAKPKLPRPAPITTSFDFSTLPAYRQMSMQVAAGEMIGVKSPFFHKGTQAKGANITINNQQCLQFASYDYLGLNQKHAVRRAAIDAVEKWGVSATASRLVGGERPFHQELESLIAKTYGVEAALAMVSGHATNVSVIAALAGPNDLVLIDSLIHNSVSEGVRLSGAARMVFPHNDLDWLDNKLTGIRAKYKRVLIVVEGLYSMDGDTPDLKNLVDIKTRHEAWLMVDEAHSFGVLGASGRGISEHCAVPTDAIEIWMGTLSKALGSSGGFIAGSAALIDFLRFKAAGFVFSVGLSAPLAAAASAALSCRASWPVARLRRNGKYFLDSAKSAGLNVGLSAGHAITPVIVGDSMRAVIAANKLIERGINALPIIFPAVPEKQARLRFFITSHHDFNDIDLAVRHTSAIMKEVYDMPSLATMIKSA